MSPVSVFDSAPKPACACHACIDKYDLRSPEGLPLGLTQLVVCPVCGNKRCPRASNHELACTGSNASGQPGSVYG